jgi:nitrous oxidase accessory protein
MGKPKWGATFLAVILFASFYVAATKPTVKASSLLAVEPPEGSIVVPDDFSTINEAIENAPEGGTVFVRNGNYRERVRVTKPLTLLGEDPKNTVISFDIDHFLVNGVIEIEAADVTISGFTIKGSWIGIWTPVDYNAPPRSRCKIIGNNIIDNVSDGISMDGENHVISGNNITGNRENGIYVSASNSVISGNNITGNDGLGVTVNSSNVTISGNNITGNGGDAGSSSKRKGGLMLRWDGTYYVYGNNITDNQRYGIVFATRCNNTIVYQNNIARNSIGVELINFKLSESSSHWSDNTVYRNNFIDNSQQVVINQRWESDT